MTHFKITYSKGHRSFFAFRDYVLKVISSVFFETLSPSFIKTWSITPDNGDFIGFCAPKACNSPLETTTSSILEKQAELLKVKFGSAVHSDDHDNVMVSIPGLRGREPKEISVKNLTEIISARMKEIIDLVYHQIKVSGYEDKLMTGIVLTGGGAQLRKLNQLVSFITGMEARVGYPNEHLGKESKDNVTGPMYSTGTGLVMKGFQDMPSNENNIKNNNKSETSLLKIFKEIKGFFDEEIE